MWLHRPPGSSSWLHCNSHKKKSFLLFLTPCLSTRQHLTQDPAFCHFLQGSYCLPNSRHSTGILFSTRFYSTWSSCVQCVWSMGVCECVCAYCSSAVKTTHRLSVKSACRPQSCTSGSTILSGASSDPATWEWWARAFPAIFSSFWRWPRLFTEEPAGAGKGCISLIKTTSQAADYLQRWDKGWK